MRRRIWVEHLPAEVLAESATLDLLERYRLEPIVALPPERETGAMADALAAMSRRGLRVGLWPLLLDEEGYWPSVKSAPAFEARVEAALSFANEAGADIRTVAIDLEPPLEELKVLLEGSGPARWSFIARQRKDDAGVFERLARSLAGRGIETIAAVLPPVLLDLDRRRPFWESVLGTPATSVPWNVVSPMLYTTMIAALLPSRSTHSARGILFAGADRLARSVGGARASVSLGLVGTGKLGTEPTYDRPASLALDVGAARAAGIEDLALFALEGVLERGPPERWLDAFGAPPLRPTRARRIVAGAVFRAGDVFTLLGGLARRR